MRGRALPACAMALFAGLLSHTAARADGGAPPPAWTHEIEVAIDPAAHALKATDRIVVGAAGGVLGFRLHAGLTISSFTVDGKESLGSLRRPEPGPTTDARGRDHLADWQGPEVAPGAHLRIAYEGTIHDAVSAETGLGFVAGDSTSGLIAPEGVFLDGGTGWVPIVETPGGEMAMYNVTSRVPEPWKVVTQGRRAPAGPGKQGVSVARHVAEVPSDGLALVAGRYTVKSIEHGGVVISTYFFEEEAAQADAFLASTASYLDRFAAVLTPYPYARFDIVENFFTTGYGFPSFTLLGRDVVKMGEQALRPGYVDHEVMHCWWGNYVYPDMKTGNWCEGLTTYYANYLAQETAGATQAADYRRGIAQKYSLRVRPDVDYPLARFTEKTRDFDNEIGYGKAAMVFHMLRRMAGDEVFFRTMREFVVKFGGRRAGWADFRAAFEQSTGRALSGFFSEWIDRPGLPSLALATARVTPGGGGADARYVIDGTVEQTGPAPGPLYHLTVPLVVRTAQGRQETALEVSDRSTAFTIRTKDLPLEIRLDPEMHVPRWLLAPDIPPCLNAALEDDGLRILLPSEPGDAYTKLGEKAQTARGAAIVRDGEMTDGLPAGVSLLVLGRPDQNGAAARMLQRADSPIRVGATGFSVAGETFDGPEYSVLYSERRADDPNHVVTYFFGMTPESLERSRNLFYYGWDSWVVFKSGRPQRRGTFEIGGARARRLLVTDISGGPGGIDRTALLEHARALASPAMEGRRPGTAGHEAAAGYIETFLSGHGVAPASQVAGFIEGYRHTFALPLIDVDPQAGDFQVRLRPDAGGPSYPARALPFAPPAPGEPSSASSAEVVFLDPEDLASQAGAATSPRLAGGTILTVERPLPPEEGAPGARGRPEIDPRAAALLADEVRGAARLGASTLIIVRGSDAPAAFEPLISFPSRPSAADAETIAAKRKAGEFPGVDNFFAGRAGRLPFPGAPPEMLVLSTGPELGIDLLGRHAFARHAATPLEARDPGYKPIQLDLTLSASAPLRVARKPMVSLVGYLPGGDPALSGEVVLATAHYDALGRAEDGALLAGASDNAAGVAALMEAARWLAEPSRRPARGVLVAALDGEEWGLAGSRALAGRLAEMSVRPVAVVNIDSIGSPEVAAPYLIGGSYRPEIRSAVETLAALSGMSLGRDIDAYAFEYGSDFYPFHLAGVPSVGFFAANYRALHRSSDNAEALDPEALEKVARLAALTIWALAN